MMNCGYDPAPGGKYDLPPIAPQMWHAYHIAGEQLTFAIVAALLYRFRTGKGQLVSCRGARGGFEIHRGRSHDVGHAPRAGPAPDLPSCTRVGVAQPVHRAHQGRPLGHGEPRQPPDDGEAARLTAPRAAMASERVISTRDGDAERRTLRSRHRSRSTRSRDLGHGSRAAFRARVHLREHAVARSAGSGNAVGAAAETSRERRRSALDQARKLSPTSSIPSSASRSATPRANGSPPRTDGSAGRRAPLLNEDAESDRWPQPKRETPVIGANAKVDRETSRRRSAASRFRCTASASSTSRGSSRPPAARGS